MIVHKAFGAAIATVGSKAEPMLHFFTALTLTTMKVVEWIILLAPIGNNKQRIVIIYYWTIR